MSNPLLWALLASHQWTRPIYYTLIFLRFTEGPKCDRCCAQYCKKEIHSKLVTFLTARVKYLMRSNLEQGFILTYSVRFITRHGWEGMAAGMWGSRSHGLCGQEVGLDWIASRLSPSDPLPPLRLHLKAHPAAGDHVCKHVSVKERVCHIQKITDGLEKHGEQLCAFGKSAWNPSVATSFFNLITLCLWDSAFLFLTWRRHFYDCRRN